MTDKVKTSTNDELIKRFMAAVRGEEQEEILTLMEEILERMGKQKIEPEGDALDEHFEQSHPMRGSFGDRE